MLKRISQILARLAAPVARPLAVLAVPATILIAPPSLAAQEVAGRCTTTDSVVVRGAQRVNEVRIRTESGITKGNTLNFPTLQRSLKALYNMGEFHDVQALVAHVEDAQVGDDPVDHALPCQGQSALFCQHS